MYLINWKYKPVMAIIDAIGSVVYCLRRRTLPKNPKKVLFMRLEHIGDMVMATPVFETFKTNNPNCQVHVLCRGLTAPILNNNPYVDKVIEFDAPWLSSTYKSTGKNQKEIIKELKEENYDIIFEMHGDPRSLCFANELKSFVIGYTCRGFGFLCNKKVKYNPTIPNINQNLALIKDYCTTLYEKPKIFQDPLFVNRSYVKGHYIIINPRSGKREKDLTDDEIYKLIALNIPVIITGSTDDIENNKKFDKFTNVTNLTGKTDLLTLIELTRQAQKVYCPDTGIMHIAYAVGTQCDASFKTTDKSIWGY